MQDKSARVQKNLLLRGLHRVQLCTGPAYLRKISVLPPRSSLSAMAALTKGGRIPSSNRYPVRHKDPGLAAKVHQRSL